MEKINCCRNVTTIPETLTNLTTLSCSSTKVTTIPDTLTKLTKLFCSITNVTTIPETLTKLTRKSRRSQTHW